jgi:cupin fold WbuC family metalloprotein
MQLRKINDEVFYSVDNIVTFTAEDIERLKTAAKENIRKRARICAHPDENNRLHEMLIVLGRDNYIRPHRHPGKSESFHVIEGTADVVLFDDSGTAIERFRLGDCQSGLKFYFRIDRALFHSVVVTSDAFVFHETTSGPFDRADTDFAIWSPAEANISEGNLFLCRSIQNLEVPHGA